MHTSLKQTIKSLLFAGAALMILVAGSANWPKH
jgi:hypothetical protein